MVGSMIPAPPGPLNTLREDQAALLYALMEEGVDFIVVGGYAMRCLGLLRHTQDLDLVIEQSEENVRRVQAACGRLPGSNTELIALALQKPEQKLIRHDVEIFSSMTGLSYSAMRAEANQCEWRGMSLKFMSSRWMQKAKTLALQATNRQAKRSTDAEDLEFLVHAMKPNHSFNGTPNGDR